MTEPLKVTIRDVRTAKMCASGARQFFKRHNLDWQEFLKDGIDAKQLLEIDDAMAHQCVKVAENGRK